MSHQVPFPPVAMLQIYRDLTHKLCNISLTVSGSTHKHSTRAFTIQQPAMRQVREVLRLPCNLRHNSPIASQLESLFLYWMARVQSQCPFRTEINFQVVKLLDCCLPHWMGTEIEPWPFSNRKLHNVCSCASFMIGLQYMYLHMYLPHMKVRQLVLPM